MRTRSQGALETASVNLDFILRSPGSFKQGNDTIKHLSLENCAGYIYKTIASGAGMRAVRSPARRSPWESRRQRVVS